MSHYLKNRKVNSIKQGPSPVNFSPNILLPHRNQIVIIKENQIVENRVGGRENFFHCEKCGSCYATSLQDNHSCVENSMQNHCPICYEVEATIMPEEYRDKKVWILCNDCNATSEVLFHILGLKCNPCGSYNTRQTAGTSISSVTDT